MRLILNSMRQDVDNSMSLLKVKVSKNEKKVIFIEQDHQGQGGSSSSSSPFSSRSIFASTKSLLQAGLMACAGGVYVLPGPTLFCTHLLGAYFYD